MKLLQNKCLWLTGLSGSGKSTIANALLAALKKEGLRVKVLDGDILRTGLNADLGFTAEDRQENIRRVAHVTKLFLEEGYWVLSAFITPSESLRTLARSIVGEGQYLEIYVKASYEVCRKRDPKGLYKKVAEGKIVNFTGLDSVFETPLNPDLTVDTEADTHEETIEKILAFIRG